MKAKNSSNFFSYSQLSTFNNCQQQYKIIYLDGNRKKHESIEAFIGKRVHETLEWLYNDKNMIKSYITFDSICENYDKKWSKEWHDDIYITDYTKNSAYYYAIGKKCLSNYYSRYGPIFNQKVENTEIELIFMIEGYKLRGVIDRLDQPESGKWIVHDYKTGKNIKSKRQALNDIQLALYQIAIEQNYNNIDEIYLNWHFLRTGNEVSITHNKEHLKKIEKKIGKNIERIIALMNNENNFIPNETLLCNWCYYWEECSAKIGRNLAKRAI